MALNPSMYDSHTPNAVEGEVFLLQRKGISLELKADGFPTIKAKGELYLTTLRMVFVTPKQVHTGGIDFKAFDMPLAYTRDERFNQPIFGANYISMQVNPIQGGGLDVPCTIKLTFKEGGVGTFLPLFLRALSEIRSPRPTGSPTPLSVEVLAGGLASVAFVDPNDPSILYVSQPPIPTAQIHSVSSVTPAEAVSVQTTTTAVPLPTQRSKKDDDDIPVAHAAPRN